MSSEMQRLVALDRIGPLGMSFDVEAAPEELPAIAARLRIVALAGLGCAFKLRRVGETTIEAQGALQAQVTETCVVSLDPFGHAVREAFTLHFVPAGTEDDNLDPEAIDEIPYSGSAIDLGEAAVEQLALALDPYPRKPGAALPRDHDTEPSGPFAALRTLRRED